MLPALAGITVALLALGPAARVRPGGTGLAMAGLCALALLLAVAAIVLGGVATLTLPLGPPGAGMVLALDPLAAFFILPVGVAGVAAGLVGRDAPPLLPVFAGAMLLTLLAGSQFAFVLGFAAMAACGWGLIGCTGIAVTGPVCLLAALALAAPASGFDAIRAAPPEGWRAAAVLALTLAGAAPALGLAPLHRWLAPAHDAASGPVAALLVGGMARVGAYAVIRILLDLCGAATPGWWGAPLLALGVTSAVLGGVRANRAATLQSVLAGMAVQNAGFMAAGLGVALAARGADLPALSSLALGAAMLLALNHAVVQVLAALCASAAEHAAATRALDRLGGLAQSAPVIAMCMVVAAASLACLPLTAGFAPLWLLLETLIAAPRIGGFGPQMAAAVGTALVAMAAALGAAAMLRLTGVGVLGRPRTPRAAAAEDASGLTRVTLTGLAGLSAALGLLPGATLALTGGARQALSAAGLRERADWTGIDVAAGLPGYLPLGLALLTGGVGVAAWLAVRRLPAPQVAAAWEDGFAPSPPWLPFGDPATQYDSASVAAPLVDLLRLKRVAVPRGWRFWHARAAAVLPPPGHHPRAALGVLIVMAAAALAGVIWLEGA